MTGWTVLWTVAIGIVVVFGAATDCAYLMATSIVLPLIWADQHITKHYPEEKP